MLIIGPDWIAFHTPEEAEAALEGFKFKGTGWYETKTDTLLVLDIVEVGKHAGRHEFLCWNYPDARRELADRMSTITHMPVRVKNY